MKTPVSILLVTEGTYPYQSGGVSTWAQQLCEKVRHARFTIYSINAGVEEFSKFRKPRNVDTIVQLPMWAPDEPYDCIDYGIPYSSLVERRETTTSEDIRKEFIPHFKDFLTSLLSQQYSIVDLDLAIYGIWKFFRAYDYKVTMTSREVWECYKESIASVLQKEELRTLKLQDLTTGMRWLYRFMMPISIEPPNADIVHMTISGVALFPALSVKYRFNSPILLTEHGVYIRERLISIGNSNFSPFLKKLLISFSEALTKLVYYHADVITTVSEFNIRWERYYGADPSKIKVIYNGVDTQLFCPRTKPIHLSTTPTVVAAARIFELKDIKTMIRVCALVAKKIPDVQFLVYGNKDAVPEYTTECLELINELRVEHNFQLKGFHDKPEEIYSEGDISILTSISEGFPYTVLESMSCGIPVVATDVGGVSEALSDDCGFLTKPKDFTALAERVIWLLENKEIREQMGVNCRDRVLKNFSLEHFTVAFECTYLSMMEMDQHETVENLKVSILNYGKNRA